MSIHKQSHMHTCLTSPRPSSACAYSSPHSCTPSSSCASSSSSSSQCCGRSCSGVQCAVGAACWNAQALLPVQMCNTLPLQMCNTLSVQMRRKHVSHLNHAPPPLSSGNIAFSAEQGQWASLSKSWFSTIQVLLCIFAADCCFFC